MTILDGDLQRQSVWKSFNCSAGWRFEVTRATATVGEASRVQLYANAQRLFNFDLVV